MRYVKLTAALLFMLCLLGPSVQADWVSGRYKDGDKSWALRLGVGSLNGIEGSVTETKRAGATEVTTEGEFLETYSFEELGLADSYASISFDAEKQWKYITLQANLLYSKLDGSAVARRDYAIGVESISFEGTEYEYQLIKGGTPFESELDTLIFDFKMRITPAHIEFPDGRGAFTPWIILGIYAAGGDFTVDAGPATGTQLYEQDPFVYVVGGKSEGTAGALLPQFGLGAETRLTLWPVGEDEYAELILQMEYSFLDIVARTGDFGVSSRNEKNIDTDFFNFEARAELEIPLSPETDLLVGFAYKHVDINAEIEADRQAPGEETTEKYDKIADAVIKGYSVFAGFKF